MDSMSVKDLRWLTERSKGVVSPIVTSRSLSRHPSCVAALTMKDQSMDCVSAKEARRSVEW